MPITYPLELPAGGFASIVLHDVDVVGVNESPYNLVQQIYEWDGQRWEADVTLPVLKGALAAAWEAFSGKVRGRRGTFLLGDPARQTPRGSAASAPGTPLVDGIHAARVDEVALKGLPADAVGYLLEGDHIQFGSGGTARLHKVLEDVDVDESGNATLLIWPRTRAALADEAVVIVSGCKGLFRLAENTRSFARKPGTFTNFSFRCVEALS